MTAKPRESAGEAIERQLMAEWIKHDPAAINTELGTDDEARDLIKKHRLYVAYNSHATEPRWEIEAGSHRTYFNEYSEAKSLGDAVRECVASIRQEGIDD